MNTHSFWPIDGQICPGEIVDLIKLAKEFQHNQHDFFFISNY